MRVLNIYIRIMNVIRCNKYIMHTPISLCAYNCCFILGFPCIPDPTLVRFHFWHALMDKVDHHVLLVVQSRPVPRLCSWFLRFLLHVDPACSLLILAKPHRRSKIIQDGKIRNGFWWGTPSGTQAHVYLGTLTVNIYPHQAIKPHGESHVIPWHPMMKVRLFNGDAIDETTTYLHYNRVIPSW